MSKVAVRIQYNVAASPPPYTWNTIDFYDYEIADTDGWPGKSSVEKVLGNGAPKIIKRSGYGFVLLSFNLNTFDTPTTIQKLQTLDEFNGDDQRFVVYPIYQSDASYLKICALPVGQIPDFAGVAGYNRHNAPLQVKFLISDKNVGGAPEYYA